MSEKGVRSKTVKYATKKLPEDCRELFLQIWKLINCMDLYDGNLNNYFQVIEQRIRVIKEENEELQKRITECIKILKAG